MLMASMNLQVVTDTVIVPEPNSLLETNSLTHTPWMRQVIFAHHQVCQALVCIDRVYLYHQAYAAVSGNHTFVKTYPQAHINQNPPLLNIK
jgi:hypothetical protein